MEKPLISILIPVYNVERYLSQCLDSVLAQTYPNIEIICCDDCSTDSSFTILKRYQEQHKHIRVIQNSKNKGLFDTRLAMFQEVHGDYIYILDSDDWIEPYAIEQLYKYSAFDCVIGSATIHHTNGSLSTLQSFSTKQEFFLFGSDVYEFHKTMVVSYSIWNILIKATLIQSILPELLVHKEKHINLGEDILIRACLCRVATSMAFIPKETHHYRRIENSLDPSIHQEGKNKEFILETLQKRIDALGRTSAIFNYENAKVIYETKYWLTKDIARYYTIFSKSELHNIDTLLRNVSIFNLFSEIRQERYKRLLRKLHLIKPAKAIIKLKKKIIHFLKRRSTLKRIKPLYRKMKSLRRNIKEYTKGLRDARVLQKYNSPYKEHTPKRNTKKIDLVYMWVDGNDPTWQKKLSQYKPGVTESEATHSCRFETIDELKYSLRSVEKYANWINHIYIITDRQTPVWLAKNPKITVVDHTEICPPEILPLFNSNAIELFIHNIPNLSECFLLANDDMLFFNHVKRRDFFHKNGSAKNYFTKPYNSKNFGSWEYTILEVLDRVHQKLETPLEIFPSHVIDSYNKSDYQYTEEVLFEQWAKDTSTHRFREPLELTRFAVNLVSIARNNTKPYLIRKKIRDIRSTYPYNWFGFTINLHNFTEQVWRTAEKAKPKLICLNDSIQVTKAHKVLAQQFLDQNFPNKSSFEK